MRAQSSPGQPRMQHCRAWHKEIFICFGVFSAAKRAFEGAVLVLGGALGAEGNFWLLLTCCEISDIRLRTNIIELQ